MSIDELCEKLEYLIERLAIFIYIYVVVLFFMNEMFG